MDWEFVYVLPNLSLTFERRGGNSDVGPNGLDLGTDLVAIVGPADDRALRLRAGNPAFAQVLDSFRDLRGDAYPPAVVIIRPTAPTALKRDAEAFVAFRNAVAMSVILRGRAAAAKKDNALSPIWSDTFDFHPAQIGGSGSMILQSPAMLAGVANKEPLLLTHSPYLPVEGTWLWIDQYLYRVLGVEWSKRYVARRLNATYGRSLFRSLEVAYTACSIGAKNQGSVHDYGLQVALWVSAIEILAWPRRSHADFDQVLDLLARAPMNRALRDRRYIATIRRRKRRLNALERGYAYLYQARNRFLHGNPVTPHTLFTRSRSKIEAITRIAAIVYRAALVAYLDARHRASVRSWDELKARPNELVDKWSYDAALAELFGRSMD